MWVGWVAFMGYLEPSYINHVAKLRPGSESEAAETAGIVVSAQYQKRGLEPVCQRSANWLAPRSWHCSPHCTAVHTALPSTLHCSPHYTAVQTAVQCSAVHCRLYALSHSTLRIACSTSSARSSTSCPLPHNDSSEMFTTIVHCPQCCAI